MTNRFIYIALLSLTAFIFSACEQEDAPGTYDTDDLTVAFLPSLPGVSSRAHINYDDGIKSIFNDDEKFLITAFKPEEADPGTLNPFAEQFTVTPRQDGAYRNDTIRWPGNRGTNNGKMMFYAFFPSCKTLRKQIGAEDTDFLLTNLSNKEPSGNVTYNYRINSFRIHNDISKQNDFVAASYDGNKSDNLYSGVNLNFEHQLCYVDFLAWNSESEYNVEIAAVKICNVMTQGDFRFGPAPYAGENDNTGGHWEYPEKYKKDTVGYIYKEGEKLFVIDGNNHTKHETAGSIFGTAGHALLLPCGHKKWNHQDDPTNKAGGLYITALLRVEKRSTGVQIYPEPGHKYGSGGVHYYLINKKDSTIVEKDLKLYINDITNGGNVIGGDQKTEGPDRIIEVGADDKPVYYNSDGSKYEVPDGCEVKELSWAAVPFEVNWKPGYRYTYYLDYGKGVGVHDPTDIGNNVAPNVIKIGFDKWQNEESLTNPITGAYTVTLVIGYK